MTGRKPIEHEDLSRHEAAREAAESLADAVEVYAFTPDKDLDKLKAAWRAYCVAVDTGRRLPWKTLSGASGDNPGDVS